MTRDEKMECTTDWRNEPAPTHRCNVCGALWRHWPTRDTGQVAAWNLRSIACGPCCDNTAMGDQIKPLTLGEMENYLRARLAVDVMTQHSQGSDNLPDDYEV